MVIGSLLALAALAVCLPLLAWAVQETLTVSLPAAVEGWRRMRRKSRETRRPRSWDPLHAILDDDGFQEFMHAAPKIPVHRDVDSWRMPRLLVRVPMRHEEDIQAVRVYDSTKVDPVYLRVPLHVRTCREAVAWTFDMDAGAYRPDQET